MASVSFRGLQKRYGSIEVVKGIDLEIEDREFVVLVGPSGCGKSTTLRMLAGLETISGGEIMIGDRIVSHLPPRERNIAMVFQDYALYPHKSVFDNIAFSLRIRKVPSHEIEARVKVTAEMLGIAHLLDRMPRQLSGGQRQRVAMGRAIVRQPDIFLFDEPLSNLDAQLRSQVRTEIKKLHQTIGTTILYVTHDQVEAMTLADRIVILRGGLIEQVGTPDEVYNNPASVFVGGFVGSPAMNFVRARLDEGSIVFSGAERAPIPAAYVGAATKLRGGEVIVGIRPEHFVMGDASASRITCRVEVVEPLGSDTLLSLSIGGNGLVARVPPDLRPAPGTTMTLGLDADRLSLFDAETERALR